MFEFIVIIAFLVVIVLLGSILVAINEIRTAITIKSSTILSSTDSDAVASLDQLNDHIKKTQKMIDDYAWASLSPAQYSEYGRVKSSHNYTYSSKPKPKSSFLEWSRKHPQSLQNTDATYQQK